MFYDLNCHRCKQNFGQVEISDEQINARDLGVVSDEEAFHHLDRNEIILFNTNLCETCFDMDDDELDQLFPLDEVAPVFQSDE